MFAIANALQFMIYVKYVIGFELEETVSFVDDQESEHDEDDLTTNFMRLLGDGRILDCQKGRSSKLK